MEQNFADQNIARSKAPVAAPVAALLAGASLAALAAQELPLQGNEPDFGRDSFSRPVPQLSELSAPLRVAALREPGAVVQEPKPPAAKISPPEDPSLTTSKPIAAEIRATLTFPNPIDKENRHWLGRLSGLLDVSFYLVAVPAAIRDYLRSEKAPPKYAWTALSANMLLFAACTGALEASENLYMTVCASAGSVLMAGMGWVFGSKEQIKWNEPRNYLRAAALIGGWLAYAVGTQVVPGVDMRPLALAPAILGNWIGLTLLFDSFKARQLEHGFNDSSRTPWLVSAGAMLANFLATPSSDPLVLAGPLNFLICAGVILYAHWRSSQRIAVAASDLR
jgi:hypothetical protein